MSRCPRVSNLNSAKRIEKLQLELDFAMTSFGSQRDQILFLRSQLAAAYKDEETYWQTKSRITWLAEGDRNTKFFQACTKIRYSKNRIQSVKDASGTVHSNDISIGIHAQDFFSNIYKSNNKPVQHHIFDGFSRTVTDEINTSLTRDFTDEEIFQEVCSIGEDRGPGLDGITARFYQHC